MIKRKIINIDEILCDGCALCIPSCPEGALQIIDGKAKLIKESFCDGIGACLKDCPQGALTITEVITDEYDHNGVMDHLRINAPEKSNTHLHHLKMHKNTLEQKHNTSSECPSTKFISFEGKQQIQQESPQLSQLCQWPIQLHLLHPNAPYFKNANIVIIADCVPFVYPNFHSDYMKGNAIAIGCPKLDDGEAYVDKISQILGHSQPNSIKVVIMEVPCCSGLVTITRQAVINSGISVPIEVSVISISGEIIKRQTID